MKHQGINFLNYKVLVAEQLKLERSILVWPRKIKTVVSKVKTPYTDTVKLIIRDKTNTSSGFELVAC